MLKLANRLRFNLTNAFARYFKDLPDFFERVRVAVGKPEPQPQNLTFAERKRGKRLVEPLAQRGTVDFNERVAFVRIF